MKHRSAVSLEFLSFAAIAFIAGLWWSIAHLVNGPLAHLVHSRFEAFFAVLAITLICVSLVTGVLVGAWDSLQEHIPGHRPFTLRPLLHH